jgi:hypothetical protein
MHILQPPQLTRHTSGQASKYAPVDVPLKHIPVRRSGSRFSVIDGLIIAILIANEHEAAATNTRVIHPDNTDA